MVAPSRESAEVSLRLATPVDGAFLDRAQAELEEVLHARLAATYARRAIAWRPRWMRHGTAYADWRSVRIMDSRIPAYFMLALSLVGLVLALQAAPGEHFLENRQQDVLFFVFTPLVFWFPFGRWARWVDRYTARRPQSPLMGKLARIHARRMIKPARPAAPYVAEYLVTGKRIVYARVMDERRDERREVVWERDLAGWHHTAEHFTLLFKKEGAELPYCLILHGQSAALTACLAQLGIAPSVPAAD